MKAIFLYLLCLAFCMCTCFKTLFPCLLFFSLVVSCLYFNAVCVFEISNTSWICSMNWCVTLCNSVNACYRLCITVCSLSTHTYFCLIKVSQWLFKNYLRSTAALYINPVCVTWFWNKTLNINFLFVTSNERFVTLLSVCSLHPVLLFWGF